MKILWSILLSFIVFASSFQSSLVLIDYHINQEFYETHCENKDKPELSCHGKCQLNQEQEKNTALYLVAKFCFEMNLLPSEDILVSEKPALNLECNKNVFDLPTNPILEGFHNKITKPPQI